MSAVEKQAHRCFYIFLRVLSGPRASSMQSFRSSLTAPFISNFPLHSSYPPVPSPPAPLQLLSRQFLYPLLQVPLLQLPCHSVHPPPIRLLRSPLLTSPHLQLTYPFHSPSITIHLSPFFHSHTVIQLSSSSTPLQTPPYQLTSSSATLPITSRDVISSPPSSYPPLPSSSLIFPFSFFPLPLQLFSPSLPAHS